VPFGWKTNPKYYGKSPPHDTRIYISGLYLNSQVLYRIKRLEDDEQAKPQEGQSGRGEDMRLALCSAGL
jgi:hypothetical protein